MKKEMAYEFRDKLLTVHESGIRDHSLTHYDNEIALYDGAVINIACENNELISTAAADFVDYLSVSMGISATVTVEGKSNGDNTVTLFMAKDHPVELLEAKGYKGFLIDVNDGIRIYGYDDRGLCSALYYIEDLMNMRKAPFLTKGQIRKRPMMSPLMIHSGYGMEEWPDKYLMRVAHEGRDALLVFVEGPNRTRVGYLDFNDLIKRAARYGLDVYAYSFMPAGVHPDDEGAEEFYDKLYGDLFREFPGFKGVTLVGEVVEFYSKDPNVSKHRSWDGEKDAVPDGKFYPGWYPCEDYPKWVKLIKKVVRRAKPDADIVLWSYNWGFQPEELRVRLIENLPEDITLQATFEMFDNKKLGDVYTSCDDYSLAYVGPGPYFLSEAAAAKKRGIRLYAMTQAGGVTWDFGCVPYLPMPYQWAKRFDAIRAAIHDYGLAGGMECHHHGFYPSIISKLSKLAFMTPEEPIEDILDRILASEYGDENLERVREGFRLFSEAITYFTPSNADLNGASRIGPAYPFCLFDQTKIPYEKSAMFGARVVSLRPGKDVGDSTSASKIPKKNLLPLRINAELDSLERMLSLMKAGIAVFEEIPVKNEKLSSLLNLGKYLMHCVVTNINAKKWFKLKCIMDASFSRDEMMKTINEMEKLLKAELENAKETLPIVDADSRLGWEPSMLYLGDREHIEWKIKQVEYVLEKELLYARRATELC